MNCSLIICTFDWPEALEYVLKSAAYQSILPNEIIIADDGSDIRTKKMIDNFKKNSELKVIHSWQKNLGCRIPHSRNLAISKSKYDYIIMIDGDTILHKDFVKDHLRIAKKGFYTQGSRVLLQSKYTKNIFKSNFFLKPSFFSKNSKNKFNMLRLPLLSLLIGKFKDQDVRRVRGCNFSIYKEDIYKVNGFNEEITSWGREDSEFVQRLFNAGVFKQHLKFSGIQYHLFHKERVLNSKESADLNNHILEHAIENNLIRCNKGLDSYN